MSDPGAAASARLGELVRELRSRGGRAGVGELLSAHRALCAVDAGSREEARLALRVALCSCREDLARFDAAFLAVFGDGRHAGREAPLEELGAIGRAALPRAGVPDERSPAPSPAGERHPVPAAFSPVELLRERDFAQLTEIERIQAQRLIRSLARRGATRRSRRRRAVRRRSRTPDLRATARAALPTFGDPVHRRWRGPIRRPRPLVLVLDVSGSMAPHARMLLVYLQAAVAAHRRAEAFAFATRLTRITHELRGRDPDAALARATAAVGDLAGGTRIGDALAELNRVHGRRLGRGAVAIILSDGWDRGDPARLAAEMARLRRTTHRLIWLNPLAAHPAWAPLTQGMRAAMPHADTLLAGNTIGSLEELAETMEAM